MLRTENKSLIQILVSMSVTHIFRKRPCDEVSKSIFLVLGTLVGICYSSPIFVVFFIPIGVVYWFAQKVYIKTARQLKRMESAARSPIYSLFRWAQKANEKGLLCKLDVDKVSFVPKISARPYRDCQL